jgi:hypothetical protein
MSKNRPRRQLQAERIPRERRRMSPKAMPRIRKGAKQAPKQLPVDVDPPQPGTRGEIFVPERE